MSDAIEDVTGSLGATGDSHRRVSDSHKEIGDSRRRVSDSHKEIGDPHKEIRAPRGGRGATVSTRTDAVRRAMRSVRVRSEADAVESVDVDVMNDALALARAPSTVLSGHGLYDGGARAVMSGARAMMSEALITGREAVRVANEAVNVRRASLGTARGSS